MDVSALWDFDDLESSEARFGVSAQEATGEERLILLTQVARVRGLQGEFDEGHAVLDAILAPGPEAEVRVALERGRLLRSAGNDARAKPWFENAAEAAARAGLDDLEIDALHMIPLCLQGDERVAATHAALDRARAATSAEGRRWVASLLNNLGMAHADEGDWGSALRAFEEALAERRHHDDESGEFIARWMIAWALRNLGRVDEARDAQRELKTDLAAAGRSDPYVDEELALLGE